MGKFSYCCRSAQNTHEKWLSRPRRQPQILLVNPNGGLGLPEEPGVYPSSCLRKRGIQLYIDIDIDTHVSVYLYVCMYTYIYIY